MALDFSALEGVPSAFERTVGGFQGVKQAQQEQAQVNQQRARQMQVRQALATVAANPNASRRDYIGLLTQFPELEQQLKAPLDLLNQEQRESKIAQARDVFIAMEGGNMEIAKDILNEQILASENSNDPRGAAGARAILQQIDENPEAAKNSSAMFLASAMGPDGFEGMLETLEERRTGRVMQQSEVDQAAADLGLTQAQTNKVMAETANFGAETRLKAMELEALANGKEPIPVEKRFDMEKALRSDYNKLTGEFLKVRDSYRRVLASEETAAGDLSLIFSFMKMLDPGSVVREGEFANAENAGSVPDRVRNTYNKLLSGERVSVNRDQFRSQSKKLFEAAQKGEKDVRKQLSPAIKNYGLNSDNVWGEEVKEVTTTFTTVEEAESANLPVGTEIIISGRRAIVE